MERGFNIKCWYALVGHLASIMVVTFYNYVSWETQDPTTGYFKASRVRLFSPEHVESYTSFIVLLAVLLHIYAAFNIYQALRDFNPEKLSLILLSEKLLIGFGFLSYLIFLLVAWDSTFYWLDGGLFITLLTSLLVWFTFKHHEYLMQFSDKLSEEESYRLMVHNKLLGNLAIAFLGIVLVFFNNYFSSEYYETDSGTYDAHRIRIIHPEHTSPYAYGLLLVILGLMVLNIFNIFNLMENKSLNSVKKGHLLRRVLLVTVGGSGFLLLIANYNAERAWLDIGFYVAAFMSVFNYFDLRHVTPRDIELL